MSTKKTVKASKKTNKATAETEKAYRDEGRAIVVAYLHLTPHSQRALEVALAMLEQKIPTQYILPLITRLEDMWTSNDEDAAERERVALEKAEAVSSKGENSPD